MIPPRLTLPRVALRAIVDVLDAPATSFIALVRVAGLDPARDFRGFDARGVDFGTDDLSGFDFSGADLSRADLSRATGLDRIITDSVTRWPERLRPGIPVPKMVEIPAGRFLMGAPEAESKREGMEIWEIQICFGLTAAPRSLARSDSSEA